MNFFRREPKGVIKKWILSIEKEQSLPDDIIALNFGLFEPYGIELIGSRHYDENDNDWACEEDYIPNPRNKSLNIPNDTDWEIVLNNVVFILKNIMCEYPSLKLWKVEHITVGFCDGDLVKLK